MCFIVCSISQTLTPMRFWKLSGSELKPQVIRDRVMHSPSLIPNNCTSMSGDIDATADRRVNCSVLEFSPDDFDVHDTAVHRRSST